VIVATKGDIPQNVNFAMNSSVTTTFVESNSVSFSVGMETTAITPADVAAYAKSLSVYVDCKWSPLDGCGGEAELARRR
jgi:serine protease Do